LLNLLILFIDKRVRTTLFLCNCASLWIDL